MRFAELLALMPWLVGVFIATVYRGPIISLLSRITKAKLPGLELETSKQLGKIADQSEEVADVLKSISAQIEKIAQQEKPYADYSDALRDAQRLIEDRLEKKQNSRSSGIDRDRIEIKIIAVSMTFSWPFIASKLPRILSSYPDSYADVQLAFVNPHYLEALGLEAYDIDFADEGRQRLKEIPAFCDGLASNIGERLQIKARMYKNLPHWHGILIDDEYLFLGRTDWTFSFKKPKLTVGQNKYRYFDRSSSLGIERIELFKSWQRYYIECASEAIPSDRTRTRSLGQ
jgi:hypothetical protein